VAAIIGGLNTALFILVGEHRLDDGSRDVTIREASPPLDEASGDGAGAPVSEVYTRSGPGVVSVDVASSEAGPGEASRFVLDEQGYIVTNQHVVGGRGHIGQVRQRRPGAG
jgi:S1-C subfamily serine protease